MEAIKKVEKNLEKSFKGLPHLPESTRSGLANIWPWLALIGGLVQLLAAWGLYRLANWTERISDAAQSLSIYLTNEATGLSAMDKTVIYLGVAVLAIEAVLMLMAFPKLQRRERGGWDLLFLALLVNVAYALVTIFIDARGFGSFIMGLIGTGIGMYLLFEVKSKFNKNA